MELYLISFDKPHGKEYEKDCMYRYRHIHTYIAESLYCIQQKSIILQ